MRHIALIALLFTLTACTARRAPQTLDIRLDPFGTRQIQTLAADGTATATTTCAGRAPLFVDQVTHCSVQTVAADGVTTTTVTASYGSDSTNATSMLSALGGYVVALFTRP